MFSFCAQVADVGLLTEQPLRGRLRSLARNDRYLHGTPCCRRMATAVVSLRGRFLRSRTVPAVRAATDALLRAHHASARPDHRLATGRLNRLPPRLFARI